MQKQDKNMQNKFWDDDFHACALIAGAMAYSHNKLDDSEYVRRLAYNLYEKRDKK